DCAGIRALKKRDKCHGCRFACWPRLGEMPGSSSLASPGAGVNATWTYTLGSVVFFLAALDALLVLELADRYAGSGATVDLVLLLAVFVASAVQIRWCWFLRSRRLPSAW